MLSLIIELFTEVNSGSHFVLVWRCVDSVVQCYSSLTINAIITINAIMQSIILQLGKALQYSPCK